MIIASILKYESDSRFIHTLGTRARDANPLAGAVAVRWEEHPTGTAAGDVARSLSPSWRCPWSAGRAAPRPGPPDEAPPAGPGRLPCPGIGPASWRQPLDRSPSEEPST
ncbi:hypothetical protein GCM10010246_03330 [Streptomyces cuspidosporus]|uniref:Uncharacterized protein n=1 Tax=Streptomyces cuspidosporus TaxID=66882 RepID=A0ABP5SA13_9ACTN